jgi:hypothetical protein
MSELRRSEERLSTADIVNPRRPEPVNPAVSDAAEMRDRQTDRERQPVAPRGPVASNQATAMAEPATAGQPILTGQRPPANPPASVTKQAAAPSMSPEGTQAIASAGQAQHNALFPQDELQNFRGRWDQVQTSFVDEPRAAVEQADSLVASVVKRIAEQFANEREQLEKQWDRGDSVNTEDLRQALKRYRAFFDRLLSF